MVDRRGTSHDRRRPKQLRTDLTFAAVGISCALGLVMFVVVGALGTRLTRRWHASSQGA
ncbi:MAG: hypothetical protein U0414_38175 [Polyangiaceae bacterium]